ncbi:hypothetical protein CTI12_AA285900 [Artemisia annua]|uniref:CCHC-type domain-containing protein n=1 Tax=Artemisia annua TaxID=35608 RepID=A0A2U1NA77_ARTAN|nr:hypothetical protein CTI12_AA285900 [Artemisia annua]
MANTRRSNLNQPRIQRDGEEASVTAPNENEAPNVVARPVQRLPRAPSQRNEYDEGHEVLNVVDGVNANVNRNRTMIDGGLLPNRNIENRRREDEAENDFDHYEDSLENHTRRCNNRVGSTFETFMKCKPPTFKGSTDPQVYFQWFLKMDQTFDSGVFTEAQRVSYAIRMLEGSALQWWNSGHVGQDCTSKEPICYSCKEMGHISTNCPNKKVGNTGGTNTRKDVLPRPKARAFHMTAEEEKENKETGEADETYAMYANRA